MEIMSKLVQGIIVDPIEFERLKAQAQQNRKKFVIKKVSFKKFWLKTIEGELKDADKKYRNALIKIAKSYGPQYVDVIDVALRQDRKILILGVETDENGRRTSIGGNVVEYVGPFNEIEIIAKK